MSDKMSFEIGDVISLTTDGSLHEITGVIHDSEKLYYYDDYKEKCIRFNEVENQWIRKPSTL